MKVKNDVVEIEEIKKFDKIEAFDKQGYMIAIIYSDKLDKGTKIEKTDHNFIISVWCYEIGYVGLIAADTVYIGGMEE